MPVAVQSSNQSTLQFSNPGNALVTTSYVTSSSLTDTHLLSPQQPALQRNTVSPGLPQRPASAGERVILCWVWRDWRRQWTNKYQQKQTVNYWPASSGVFGRDISDMKKQGVLLKITLFFYFCTVCSSLKSSSCLLLKDNMMFVSIVISGYSFIDLQWTLYVVPYHDM